MMQDQGEIRLFLCEYAKKHPQLETDDLIKLLYQSAFGCGHFAPLRERVLSYLREESETAQASPQGEMIEPVLGKYVRVNIAPYKARGMKIDTLARLFMLTADEPADETAKAWFHSALSLLEEIALLGELPLGGEAVRRRLRAYRADGCPSVHHSESFRAAYHPAYRIVRADYAQLLPVFARIDARLEQGGRVIVAIDGNSGAGKSTLAALLEKVYDGATLTHMDDFFLQMHQRTPERLAAPGGNVDHERFLGEVLAPMRRGEAFCYRPFDCSRMAIGEGKTVTPGRLSIVEGSYSLHPQLEAAYDVKIVLKIDPRAQAERIAKRNGPEMLRRFVGEWIPMENRYFEETKIDSRAELLVGVTTEEDGWPRYDVIKTEAGA